MYRSTHCCSSSIDLFSLYGVLSRQLVVPREIDSTFLNLESCGSADSLKPKHRSIFLPWLIIECHIDIFDQILNEAIMVFSLRRWYVFICYLRELLCLALCFPGNVTGVRRFVNDLRVDFLGSVYDFFTDAGVWLLFFEGF